MATHEQNIVDWEMDREQKRAMSPRFRSDSEHSLTGAKFLAEEIAVPTTGAERGRLATATIYRYLRRDHGFLRGLVQGISALGVAVGAVDCTKNNMPRYPRDALSLDQKRIGGDMWRILRRSRRSA